MVFGLIVAHILISSYMMTQKKSPAVLEDHFRDSGKCHDDCVLVNGDRVHQYRSKYYCRHGANSLQ